MQTKCRMSRAKQSSKKIPKVCHPCFDPPWYYCRMSGCVSADSKSLAKLQRNILKKHLFVSMSVRQNLFVSVFVHKCLIVLNDVEHTTFRSFLMQMSNYLFVVSFQLMFYTLSFSQSLRLGSN